MSPHKRVRIDGWERRQDSCPFCDGTEHSRSTHRLFGSVSSASSVASSPTISEMGFNRYSRRGSGATSTGTMGPLSRETTNCSIELDRATRARDMNDRIHMYLFSDPHEILPSATKNYPTYSTAISKAENAAGNDSDGKPRRTDSLTAVTRGIKRLSKRFSIGSDMFKHV
ncbi:hypothetical protein BST61_g1924 [Cercospora zeina]